MVEEIDTEGGYSEAAEDVDYSLENEMPLQTEEYSSIKKNPKKKERFLSQLFKGLQTQQQ